MYLPTHIPRKLTSTNCISIPTFFVYEEVLIAKFFVHTSASLELQQGDQVDVERKSHLLHTKSLVLQGCGWN